MELTNKKLLEINAALKGLKTETLPFKVSYVVGRNLKKLEKALEDYQVAFKLIQDEFIEKDENGKFVIVDNRYSIPNEDQYKEKVEELFDETVTISKLHTLQEGDFGDVKGIDPEILVPLIDTVIVE